MEVLNRHDTSNLPAAEARGFEALPSAASVQIDESQLALRLQRNQDRRVEAHREPSAVVAALGMMAADESDIHARLGHNLLSAMGAGLLSLDQGQAMMQTLNLWQRIGRQCLELENTARRIGKEDQIASRPMPR